MEKIKRYIKIYKHFLKLNIKTMLEYKADFLISLFTNIPLQIVEILFIWVIFNNIKTLDGWSFYEIALVYGMMMTAKGIADVFFDNLYEMPKQYIKKGTFDNIKLQPMHSLFNIITREIYLGAIGGIIVGIAITVVSIINLEINFFILEFLMLVIFILCGGLIFGALMTIGATFTFWIVESMEIIWSLYVFHQFTLYPIKIYSKLIIGILTYVIPYAFVSFYPATFLLRERRRKLCIFISYNSNYNLDSSNKILEIRVKKIWKHRLIKKEPKISNYVDKIKQL